MRRVRLRMVDPRARRRAGKQYPLVGEGTTPRAEYLFFGLSAEPCAAPGGTCGPTHGGTHQDPPAFRIIRLTPGAYLRQAPATAHAHILLIQAAVAHTGGG